MSAKIEDTGFKALNIMIVDDNVHMRQLVRTVLLALGVENFCDCDNAIDAFKELKSFPADFLIVDWLMSPVDGIELVRKIRTDKISPNPYVPIIMMTGHSSLDNVWEARDVGVNEFVVKPISAKSLLLKVIEVIERPRLFVKSTVYFGPDRRRTNIPVAEDRRKATSLAKPENAVGANSHEIDADDDDVFEIA